MKQLAYFTPTQRVNKSNKVTRVHQLSFIQFLIQSSQRPLNILPSLIQPFQANNYFKQWTPESSMMHILSLILMLLCQVHNLTAEEEEGGSYGNAARSSDLAGDKLCYIYNRQQLANAQMYSF